MPSLPGTPKVIEPVERAMLAMAYGVHVIGSRSAGGQFNLMLADWVMQVSFRPRLAAVAIENDARTLRFVRETGAFSVNLLHVLDGPAIAKRVVMPAEGSKIKGRSQEAASQVHDKLAGIGHFIHAAGVPVLAHALAWYTCEAEQFVSAGDHTVVIGRVTDGDMPRTGEALTEKELGWEYAG
ncbi:MAG: flavin reductase family protein [Thermoflexaceae bacterium]|nr:flavin reductase family protein [Thermoflexaceae bacterium]